MTEAMDNLVSLLESIEDTYDDFVIGTALMASDYDIVEEMSEVIEATPGITTSMVLDWIIDIKDLKPVVTINGK